VMTRCALRFHLAAANQHTRRRTSEIHVTSHLLYVEMHWLTNHHQQSPGILPRYFMLKVSTPTVTVWLSLFNESQKSKPPTKFCRNFIRSLPICEIRSPANSLLKRLLQVSKYLAN